MGDASTNSQTTTRKMDTQPTSPFQNPLTPLLAHKSTITLDGALATELERRDHDLSDPLWSATILLSHPAVIRQVHTDYYLAGADIAITASYQASARGFAEHRGIDAEGSRILIVESVTLAREARDNAQLRLGCDQLLVAGSVGPYGAYLADGSEYRGDYSVPAAELKKFHLGRIKALVDAGSDLLALETMPSFPEICVLLELLSEEVPQTAAWVSVTLDEGGVAMADGTALEDVCRLVARYQQVVALGVNCVARGKVASALRRMKRALEEEEERGTRILLLAYPNSGEVWDAESRMWSGDGGDRGEWEDFVEEWRREGVSMVGGCCGAGPEDVRRIAKALEAQG